MSDFWLFIEHYHNAQKSYFCRIDIFKHCFFPYKFLECSSSSQYAKLEGGIKNFFIKSCYTNEKFHLLGLLSFRI